MVAGIFFVFFFNDTPTTEIYTLSLHDALPIFLVRRSRAVLREHRKDREGRLGAGRDRRSEEHTSELQSRVDLVCRLLLEKKKVQQIIEGEEKEHALGTPVPDGPHAALADFGAG